MFISRFLKSERMLIAWLLGVLVFEVGFLLICGIIIYKEERIASQAKGKELVRTILDQEEEKWKELQRRWMETAILSQELREAELQMRKLEENSREGLDLETRFRLGELMFLLNSENNVQFLDLRDQRTDRGYWDVFPPGHPYGPRVDTDVIIKFPQPLSGKPFLRMDRGLLLQLEDSAAERGDPGYD